MIEEILLSQEELLYVSMALGQKSPISLGPEPLGQLSEEQKMLAMAVAERGLLARGLIASTGHLAGVNLNENLHYLMNLIEGAEKINSLKLIRRGSPHWVSCHYYRSHNGTVEITANRLGIHRLKDVSSLTDDLAVLFEIHQPKSYFVLAASSLIAAARMAEVSFENARNYLRNISPDKPMADECARILSKWECLFSVLQFGGQSGEFTEVDYYVCGKEIWAVANAGDEAGLSRKTFSKVGARGKRLGALRYRINELGALA